MVDHLDWPGLFVCVAGIRLKQSNVHRPRSTPLDASLWWLQRRILLSLYLSPTLLSLDATQHMDNGLQYCNLILRAALVAKDQISLHLLRLPVKLTTLLRLEHNFSEVGKGVPSSTFSLAPHSPVVINGQCVLL